MSKKQRPAAPKKAPRPPGRVPEEFKKFEEFVRKVVSVPKSEIDKRDTEYRDRKRSRNA